MKKNSTRLSRKVFRPVLNNTGGWKIPHQGFENDHENSTLTTHGGTIMQYFDEAVNEHIFTADLQTCLEACSTLCRTLSWAIL